MPVRLTVNRLKLIRAIEEKAAANQKEYDKALAEWEKSQADKERRYLAAIESYSKEARAGKFKPRDRSLDSYTEREYGLYGSIFNNYKPQKPQLFEHLLQPLRLSEDEKLTLDDRSDYFQFLK